MPTIMLVDDEPDMRELIGMAIEMQTGWTIRTASSPGEALASIARDVPDAVVVDMMMPGMKGDELLLAIRAVPGASHVKAVILSGKTSPIAPERRAELGVVGVITKPFDPMTLAADLGRMLGWPP
jgi:CheY-like chemotaxis protein